MRKVEPDYFTDAMTHVRVSVLEESPSRPSSAQAVLRAGRGRAWSRRSSATRRSSSTRTRTSGYGDVRLPEMQMHTTAFWLTVPEALVERQPVERALVIDALRGIAHALHTVASVGLMCDPRDLGWTIGDKSEPEGAPAKGVHGAGFDPTIFLYDRIPGGVGLSPRVFEAREELVRRARALIETCPCEQGCPACVGPVAGPELLALDPARGRKRVALMLFADLGVSSTH